MYDQQQQQRTSATNRGGPKSAVGSRDGPLNVQQQVIKNTQDTLERLAISFSKKEQEERNAKLEKQRKALEEQQRLHGSTSMETHPTSSSHQKTLSKSKNTSHAVTAAQNYDKSTISHNVEFQVFGSLDQVQRYNPLVRDELGALKWIQSYAEEHPKRTTIPASPWRKAFDQKGPMQPFMKEGADARSKAVHCGTKLLSVTNSYPFPVGLFMIGSRVSRSPEDTLWAERIEEIMNAFYITQDSLRDNAQKSSIAFVRAIPPNQTIALDSDIVFHSQDCDDRSITDANNTSPTATTTTTTPSSANTTTVNNNWAKEWINVTKESMRSGILIDDFDGSLSSEPNSGQDAPESSSETKQTLLKNRSPLAKFIMTNWDYIVFRATGETSNTKITWCVWRVQSHILERNDNRSLEERRRDSVLIEVAPVLKTVVDTALIMIDEILDKLPFARLSEHQFFLARLDSDSFKCTQGTVTPASSIEAHLEVPIVCSFTATFEFWFEVVTVARELQQQNNIQQQYTSQQQGDGATSAGSNFNGNGEYNNDEG